MFRVPIDDDLELRLLEERHAEQLFALTESNREYLREWLPWLDGIKTVEDQKAFIRRSLERFARGGGFEAGIWCQGELVGGIGLQDINWAEHKASIGYWVGSEFQGRGLVTRSCRALLAHAFDELKVNRIEIEVDPENSRSRVIPERLGFTREAVLRQAAWQYDHYIDVEIYAMLASEWRELNPGQIGS